MLPAAQRSSLLASTAWFLPGPIFLILATVILLVPAAFADPDVVLLQYDGPITPVASEFILAGIDVATEANAGALILQLDTPGGLDTDMRVIVKAILASHVPVVVFIGPGGSRAASAGAFITVAAHVAAMAPGTNIGSASPVAMMGAAMDSTMSHKVTNDAAAYMASIALEKGRNQDLTRSFVEQAVNITAEEALAEGVIEILVPTVAALLDSLDGRTVTAGGQEVSLATAEATVVPYAMGTRLKFLKQIVNPNLAYLLFLLGIYGLFFELSNPGSIIPGVLGAISILLALYAFSALPVNYSGVGLIILGVILLILEVKVPSFGALTIGGIASLLLGSIMLFDSPEQWAQVSLKVLLPAISVFIGFILLCVGLVVRGQKRQPITGIGALKGETGRVLETIGGGKNQGKIVFHGEIWDAVADGLTHPGTTVKVLEVDGRVVRVTEILKSQPKEHPVGANSGR